MASDSISFDYWYQRYIFNFSWAAWSDSNISKAHHELLDKPEQELANALIHSHFAQLGGDANPVLMTNGALQGSMNEWKPTSKFPNIHNDVLLYLLLMGGKRYSAFYLGEETTPYCHFLMLFGSNTERLVHVMGFSNANQTSNDGNFLEALMCTTICLASHRNGFEGIDLHGFLLDLVFQLQSCNIDMNQVSIENYDSIVGELAGMMIPYLSPPNQKLPEYLYQIPGCEFCDLLRTKNMDQIDLQTSNLLISGEAKDYGTSLGLADLKKIIKRIPKESRLSFIFTRSMQKSYFKRPAKPFTVEFKGSSLLQKAFFQLNVAEPKTNLESINGLPDRVSKEHGIVIFVLIPRNIAL